MRKIKNLPYINLFSKKRRNRSTIWMSLVGIGISAAVYGVSRGKNKFGSNSLKNLFKGMAPKMDISTMSNTVLTEFSDELIENTINNNKTNR